MLSTFRIKNLALVADLTLELPPGFVAVTGETGAGKSVILGALNLILGRRADRGLIRAGEESCTVEAVFDVRTLRPSLDAFLEENGLEPCEGGLLVLKRSFTAAGTNRQFVNGSPTTLATLAGIGGRLVDLHGPHDHQSLLQPARQLEILDAYGSLEGLRSAYAAEVARRRRLLAEVADLVVDERTYAQQLDLLRHQVHEIRDARLRVDEEEEVLAEHRRAANAARLLELSGAALEALGDGEGAALSVLGAVGRPLHELARIDPAAAPMVEAHAQVVEQLRDLQTSLSRHADRIELDPSRLAALEERLDVIQSLKRKYGGSVAEVLAFGEEAASRLAQLEGRDAELARLREGIAQADVALRAAGRALSDARKALLPGLEAAVVRELRTLGFRQSRFEVALETVDPGDEPALDGSDRVEFQFAPNPGEPFRPLRAIASSGELARVMLALKTVLADQDSVPVLVFDEVDANVGGETANAVGAGMARIARRHQVLCITHLAPVAAQAGHHQVVAKEVRDGRTHSRISPVEGDARVGEIARMLGGGDAARNHAAEMLKALRNGAGSR